MNTLPKELSPERCHQLREGGILRLLVNLLHEHTFDPQNKSEADFSIESFLMDFKRKAELRARLSQQIRTIVGHTAKSEDELTLLDRLGVVRMYIDRLYNFIVDWKAITQDPSKLRESIAQLDKLMEQLSKVIFKVYNADDASSPIFEQFGGVFVIVDYLRVQTRFNAKCRQFELDLIDSTHLPRVIAYSKTVLRFVVQILHDLVRYSTGDIRFSLGDSRSLHQTMVGVAEEAYSDGVLQSVQVYCHLIERLYHGQDRIVPPNRRLSTSHLKDCGVITCLTKFGRKIKDPKTLYTVLRALETLLRLDRQIVLEFVSIDGAVNMLINLLVPSKEKDEDVENAKWYEYQRQYSSCSLAQIVRYLEPQDQMNGPLLTIFESRDFASILVLRLELIALGNELPATTMSVVFLLKTILECSGDQRRKFAEMVNGKEVVKGFESSGNHFTSRTAKEIGKMFE